MKSASKHWITALSCTVLVGSTVSAQAIAPQFPKGGAAYHAVAEYQGQPMSPWETEVRVRDTTIAGAKFIVIAHRAVRENVGAVSESFAFVDPATGAVVRVSGDHRGRVPINFDLAMRGGRLVGQVVNDGSGEGVNDSLPANAVPDFVLGHVLASRDLKDGMSIIVPVFRFNTRLFEFTLTGKVTSGTYPRAGAKAPEPVWIIEGAPGFNARIVVAKSDRAVLELKLPQGTEGSQTETFAGVVK